MTQKLKMLTAAMLLCAVAICPVFAQGITLVLNGETLSPSVPPVIENGSTLVPLRIISENMGASVNWNGEDRSVYIQKGDTEIYLVMDQKSVIVNGETKELTVAPKIIGGSTMVPIRFVSENLDCAVNWDGASQTVSIIENGTVVSTPAPAPAQPEPSPQTPAAPVYTADGKHPVIDDENYPVYYTPNGEKYHNSKDCPTLARSKTIIESTLGEATDSYRDACDKCNAPILNI